MGLGIGRLCRSAMLIVSVVGLTGCPKSAPLPNSSYSEVPFEQVFDQVRHDIGPFALRGSYRVKVRGTGRVVPSLSGAVLIVPYSKFRMEVRGPVGGPMFTGVSDGEAMGFYLASENMWVYSDDLAGDVDLLTGGFAGLEDFLAMGLGRVASPDLEPVETGMSPEGPWGSFAGNEGATATLHLDPDRGLVRMLELADSAGEVKLTMTHTAHMLVDEVWYPEQTIYHFVGTDVSMEFNYSAWDRLGSIPNAFGVLAPSTAEELALSELLTLMQNGVFHLNLED